MSAQAQVLNNQDNRFECLTFTQVQGVKLISYSFNRFKYLISTSSVEENDAMQPLIIGLIWDMHLTDKVNYTSNFCIIKIAFFLYSQGQLFEQLLFKIPGKNFF